MADVFMSYVRPDRDLAERVSLGLEAAGFSVWWDREIHGGEDFSSKIEQEITAAKTVVVLWSAASQQSKWVRDEAAFARDANKLIPLKVDETEPPFGFRQVQSIDFQRWSGDPTSSAFGNLLASLRHFIGGAPASTAPVQPKAAPVGTNRVSKRSWLVGSIVAVALVAGAAMLFTGPKLGSRPPVSGNDGQIQIHAFEASTNSQELDRFAKGLADTIVQVFATNGIRTVVRDSAEGESGRASTAVGPEFSLRGRVDRVGEDLVASADVVNRRDGLVLWSRTAKRDAAEVRILQEQFAVSIAYALRCGLITRASMQGDPSTDLFAQYLRVCQAFHDDIEQTPALARRLVESAPQYAYSYWLEALANAYVTIVPTLRGGDRRPPAEIARLRKVVYDSSKIAAEMDPRFDPLLARAIVVDPSVGLAERERLLQQAIARSADEITGAAALSEYGYLLESVGRIREARSAFGRAAKENLLNQQPRLEFAFLSAWLGNIEEARHAFDETRGNRPDFDVDESRVQTEMWFGDGAIAKEIHDRIRVTGARKWGGPDCMALFATARAMNVRPSEVEIERACSADNDAVFAYFGYPEATFRGVNAHAKADSSNPRYMTLFMPHMGFVRADPRFMPLAQRLGLVDYWLDTDQWPDFCKTEQLPYNCKEAALAARAAAMK